MGQKKATSALTNLSFTGSRSQFVNRNGLAALTRRFGWTKCCFRTRAAAVAQNSSASAARKICARDRRSLVVVLCEEGMKPFRLALSASLPCVGAVKTNFRRLGVYILAGVPISKLYNIFIDLKHIFNTSCQSEFASLMSL